MLALIQRVSSASVSIAGRETATIDSGLCVFLGIATTDSDADSAYLIRKLTSVKLFSDEQGRFSKDLTEIKGSILLVPNYTLLGSLKKGRGPDLFEAMKPAAAKDLYLKFVSALKQTYTNVVTGEFGADMQVKLENDGPVTFIINSKDAVRT